MTYFYTPRFYLFGDIVAPDIGDFVKRRPKLASTREEREKKFEALLRKQKKLRKELERAAPGVDLLQLEEEEIVAILLMLDD